MQALQQLLEENPPDLHAWLLTRKPASGIEMLRQALGDGDSAAADIPPKPSNGSGDGHLPSPSEAPTAPAPATTTELGRPKADSPMATAGRNRDVLAIGVAFDSGAPVSIELEALRKHTAIFAGSGSGKTVLIRRIVEECALNGVSAIVLDPNNDLARLGDPWPEPPAGWGPGDARRAEDYLAHTDVVVWTPRREAGRPLSFRPLPEFRTVREDPDEFAEAVESAVASIVPRAKLDGRTSKAHLG
jgi:hypothetical protein